MRPYKPYSVYCPTWNTTSGGIRVMWGLYGWLLAKGQIVFQNASFENKDFIGIYPEIVNGNPMEAKTVVRWLLNEPGVMSNGIDPSPTTFDPSDKIYVFSELFNTVGVDEDHKLFLPILDTHLFKDEGRRQRPYKCVFTGKGVNRHLHPEDCVEVDRNLAQDQKHLADFLNDCEVMYAYDPVSAMYEIARLCGCRVVLFNDKYTKEEFEKYEPGLDGISWGKDEGIKVSQNFRPHYLEMKDTFSKKLDLFIEQTQ